MNATQETYTYWVCVDCYYAANGLDESERGEPYPAGVLSLIPDTADVTAGLMAAEHAADCRVNARPSSSCDGCGSALAGERFALTVWTESN